MELSDLLQRIGNNFSIIQNDCPVHYSGTEKGTELVEISNTAWKCSSKMLCASVLVKYFVPVF
jgi:hypothetical protein